MAAFFTTWLQFTVLLTPFFVLSMFLSMTIGWPESDRRRLAIRIGVASFAASIILFYFGNWIFHVFGITVDAFRIGGGALLDADGCAELRTLFDELYPKRDRMPVQQELYKALKKGAGRMGNSGRSIFGKMHEKNGGK